MQFFYALPVFISILLSLSTGVPSAFIAALLGLAGWLSCSICIAYRFPGKVVFQITLGILVYLYYGKLVFLWFFPETVKLFALGKVTPYVRDPVIWVETFLNTAVAVSALAFGIFTALTIVVPFVHKRFLNRSSIFLRQMQSLVNAPTIEVWLLIGLTFVITVELSLVYFGVATLGQKAIALPWKLAGVIFYSHTYITPAIGLLFLALSNVSRRKSLLVAGIGIFILYLGVDTLSRNSRSGVFFVCFWIALFTYLTSNQIKRRTFMVVGLLGIAGLISFPFITAKRYSEISGLSISSIVSDWFNAGEGIPPYLVVGIKFLYRLQGAESLMLVIGSNLDKLGWSLPDGISFVDYYTYEIIGYKLGSAVTASPGLLGGLYMMGGMLAIWLGTFLVSIIFTILFLLGDSQMFTTGKIFQVFVLAVLVMILVGGLTKANLLNFLAMLTVGMAMELFVSIR